MIKDIQDAINEAHNPELAEIHGGVYMLFSDGEIAMQKSGSLLWQRSLHCMKRGLDYYPAGLDFPETLSGFGYIFCTGDDAEKIREMMENSIK